MGKNVVDFYIKAVYDCDGKGYVSLKTFKIDFLNQGLNSNLTDPEFHLSQSPALFGWGGGCGAWGGWVVVL